MSDEAVETDRTVVKTYVPRYQKDAWREHAEALDMSQSEFVRAMVQAGRRGFALEPGEGGSRDATPGGDGLEDRLLAILAVDRHLSWDELVAELSNDFEERLEDALQGLQAGNRVQYSGRNGGYTLSGEVR